MACIETLDGELEKKMSALEMELLTYKQAETAYRSMVESTSDSVYMIDRNCRYLFINSRHLEERLNLSAEQVIGRPYSDFHTPEKTREFAEVVNKVFTEGISIRQEHKSHRDSRYFLRTFSPVREWPTSPVTAVTVVSKEITELKMVERSLKRTEELHRKYINSSRGMVFLIDDCFRYLLVNTSLLDYLGKKEEDLLGRTVFECMPAEMADALHRVYKKALESGETTSSNEVIGTNVYEIRAYPVQLPDNLIGIGGIIKDITEEKQTEEEKKKLEAQLVQSQKMEAIGTLAGGIAHDFNNLLMSIQGYATLMLFNVDDSHPFYQKLKGIEMQVQSGANLTKQLLGFARGGKYEVKPANLNEIINRTAEMFGRTKKEITIHEDFQQNLWTVEADRGQIEQALLNLYVNAGQAMPQGGVLHLATRNIELDKTYVKHYYVRHGKYVKITVEDTGIGMDKHVRARVFEPFFTTKEMGRGTGLGLATVYGIIKAHNGIINVYSEKGEGTVFNIYIPASEKKVRKEKFRTQELLRGSETILLVDDEDTIVDVTSELLEELGYSVLSAKSGKEAVDLYRQNKETISLVILDMIMPDMSGGVTFDALKIINPEVAVILSSGYSLNQQASSIMKRGCRKFLQKPFSSLELSHIIREVLAGKGK